MSRQIITRAVVLARGLGTRMRRADAGAALDAEQAAVADTGLKAMIPVGRPFLDFVLSGLADAGFTDVCLVIGPEHDVVRSRYTEVLPPRRVKVHFAIQEEPRGTADALLAASAFIDEQPFVVLNSDNYYPVATLRTLREHGAPALPGFDREGLVRGGNIDPARIAAFALLVVRADGTLARVVEKPDPATMEALGPDTPVSMNCWAFPPRILEACRSIEPSQRGELEIPHAAQYAIDNLGMRFHVVPTHEGVLDLSSRGDIEAVKARLASVEVRL